MRSLPTVIRRCCKYALAGSFISCVGNHASAQASVTPHQADWTPIIESLLLFHATMLHDTTKIDACSIADATGQRGIVGNLTNRARQAVTDPQDCVNKRVGASVARSLLRISRAGNEVLAEIEVVDGDYFHVATYRGLPAPARSGIAFSEVLLNRFGTIGRAPPPPPPSK